MNTKRERSARIAEAILTKESLIGVVLAGGQSQRMGRDKSLIDYHGIPQRHYAFHLLSAFCDEVYLSCRNTKDVPAELNPVEDQFSFRSPLNGILSVWAQKPQSALLTLPVDMPWVDQALISHLLAGRDPKGFATCFRDCDGQRPEPLLCLWEPKAFTPLKVFAEVGNISPRLFLESNSVALLDAENPFKLTNVNTPQDL